MTDRYDKPTRPPKELPNRTVSKISIYREGGGLRELELVQGYDPVIRARPNKPIPHTCKQYQTIQYTDRSGRRRSHKDTVYFRKEDKNRLTGIVIDEVTGTMYEVAQVAGSIWQITYILED